MPVMTYGNTKIVQEWERDIKHVCYLPVYSHHSPILRMEQVFETMELNSEMMQLVIWEDFISW